MDTSTGNTRQSDSSAAARSTSHRAVALRLALGLPVLLALTGCIHLEQTVMLNGDGSLLVTYDYSIAEHSADLVAGGREVIETWQNRPPSHPPHWLANRETVQKHFSGSGIRLHDFASEVKGGRRHVQIAVFAENGPAAINQGLFGAMRCERVGETKVRLSAALPEVPPVEDPGKQQAIAALCDDLYLMLTVKVPGDISATTADRQKRRSAVWVFEPSIENGFLGDLPAVECQFDAGRMDWAADLPEARDPGEMDRPD